MINMHSEQAIVTLVALVSHVYVVRDMVVSRPGLQTILVLMPDGFNHIHVDSIVM